jgi:hypothetical protein
MSNFSQQDTPNTGSIRLEHYNIPFGKGLTKVLGDVKDATPISILDIIGMRQNTQ